MPEKVIYSITKSGREHFLELMNRFSANPGKIFFDFNALIANLSLVDKETALEMLQDLKMSFISSKDDVDNDFAELPDVLTEGKAIMKLYRMIFRDMIKWIDELIAKAVSKSIADLIATHKTMAVKHGYQKRIR